MDIRVVRDIMLPDPPVVSPDDSLGMAGRMMLEHNQRRLAVVDDEGHLAGIISDRDLRLAADSPLLEETSAEMLETLQKHTVREIMTTAVHTIEADAPIVEAAQLMRVAKVGGLPVVEFDDSGNRERLVGMVNQSMLLDYLIMLLDDADRVEMEAGETVEGTVVDEG